MAEPSDAAERLAEVPIFVGLGRAELESIAKEGKELSFEPGQLIVGEGGTGVGFYLILDGRIEVRKGDRVLGQLGRGQFFGEASLVAGKRTADVVALERTRCWVLPSWVFSKLLETHPEVAHRTLKEAVKRFRSDLGPPSL